MKAKTKEEILRQITSHSIYYLERNFVPLRDTLRAMQEYSDQQNAELKEQLEQERKRRDAAENHITEIYVWNPNLKKEEYAHYHQWQSLVKQSEKP